MYKTFIINCIILIMSAGCGRPAGQPETKGIKIGDLAPKGTSSNPPIIQPLQTTNIDIITYELPAKNINLLDNVWAILPGNAAGLRITDPAGFAANGLRVSADTFDKKNKIINALKKIKARKLTTTSLFIQSNQPELFVLGRLTRKSTVAYIARGGADANIEAGPATLGLQVYARQFKPPAVSGQTTSAQTISRVQITPTIAASTEGLPEELAIRLKQQDLRIYSAAFGINMKPGDIIVLAPTPGKIDNEAAAAGRFFTHNRPEPMIKILLFICTSIT
jgi:hypothetical protein